MEIISGKVKKPFLVAIMGVPGVGKSTFASQFPSPIFIEKEDGSHHLDVSRAKGINTYDDMRNAFAWLLKNDHKFKTVVIDSLDWVEPLVHNAVMALDGSTSIDNAQGSYGKGYTMALKYWRTLMDDLSALRDKKGMNIVVIAHAQVKAFNDPSQPTPYDRFTMKLNDKASALWTEWVDVLGFATYETFLKVNKDDKKTRALGDGKRVLYTEYRPAFVAKNRLGLPFEIDLSFAAFRGAVENAEGRPDDSLLAEIRSLVPAVKDEKTRASVVAAVDKAGADVGKLSKILERLKEVTK